MTLWRSVQEQRNSVAEVWDVVAANAERDEDPEKAERARYTAAYLRDPDTLHWRGPTWT